MSVRTHWSKFHITGMPGQDMVMAFGLMAVACRAHELMEDDD